MKIAVFDDYKIGLVEGDNLFDVSAAMPNLPDRKQCINWLIANWSYICLPLLEKKASVQPIPLSSVKLHAANPAAPHVFAAPTNYQKHIGELQDRAVTKKGRSAREQGFFLMASGSVVGSGGTIELPRGSTRRFDHESELAVIIGLGGRDIPRERALDHVFGYSCLIDASMRIEPGVAEEERSMRKSFAGFTPLGPYLVTADEIPDPKRWKIAFG